MRILQVHAAYREAGGEDTVVAAEAALLRSLGHEVVQHGARNPGGAAGAAALALAPWNPAAARAARRAARAARPDVVHVHNTWFALSPAVMRAFAGLGLPVVMTLHNFRLVCANGQLFRDGRPCETCVGSHPWHGVRHRCWRGSAPLTVPAAATIALHRRLGTWAGDVDLYLALNEFARGRLVAGGLPPERVAVKPNFTADPGPRAVPASGSDTILYAGRLAPEKGVGILLEAWARLDPASRGSLRLDVVGDGPLRADLERRAVAGVTFVGRLGTAELRRRMLAARALVLPSVWYEGQPMVALEALAAGLPVLASDIGGLPELLGGAGADAGWLAAPGDVAGWAAALRRLADPAAVEAAGAAARARYERVHTVAVAGRLLTGVYDRALAGRP